ncbi:unnamed protein product [Soboliphyme baturini]|uniref:BHLH domain-containing protein n=1 Tax=Soboliphyme baturini TaxID=241478 RepID=A0A183IMU7_9BILA|nr:unnamed protein product [Soboliphyme baturini]
MSILDLLEAAAYLDQVDHYSNNGRCHGSEIAVSDEQSVLSNGTTTTAVAVAESPTSDDAAAAEAAASAAAELATAGGDPDNHADIDIDISSMSSSTVAAAVVVDIAHSSPPAPMLPKHDPPDTDDDPPKKLHRMSANGRDVVMRSSANAMNFDHGLHNSTRNVMYDVFPRWFRSFILLLFLSLVHSLIVFHPISMTFAATVAYSYESSYIAHVA